MRVNRGSDLINWTYYMIDWKTVKQAPSETRCVQCGGRMMKVGPAADSLGASYEGLVCHECKRVIWAKLD